tara:strand:- start:791 stop:2143 length:1353 start_codon:yes stop_codon:yes gene_type:complete
MAYLVRTPSSAGNRKTFTLSAWIKPNVPSSGAISMFSAWSADSVAGHFVWRIKADGTIGWSRWSEDSYSTRKLRDVHGWYHCVIAVDTTQATASNRIKLYVNNEQITSFSVGATYPAQNTDLPVNNTNSQTIGLNNYSSGASVYKGYMSHFNLVDGLQLTPSSFGSTDATTGEWKINTSPSVSYGTCGFFMFKDDNSANDDSGQGNNFTLSGTLTKTEDCPSNVFNTLDPLSPQTYTFSNGNNTIYRAGSTSQSTAISTLAPSSGKWYWEVKLNSGQTNYPRIGIYEMNSDNHTYTTHLGNASNGTGKWWGSGGSGSGNNIIADGNASTTAFYSFTNGDILMFAMDNDNGKLWFGKNGTWYTNDNSSTTTGTAIGNNTATPAFSTVTAGKNWTPAVFGNAGGETWQCNFGNGYFGTTQITSEGTNASGVGKFEYDVPPNFTALSTKGLNE